eukprot:1350425-Amorphochlora_amoeboformis.AAC.2
MLEDRIVFFPRRLSEVRDWIQPQSLWNDRLRDDTTQPHRDGQIYQHSKARSQLPQSSLDLQQSSRRRSNRQPLAHHTNPKGVLVIAHNVFATWKAAYFSAALTLTMLAGVNDEVHQGDCNPLCLKVAFVGVWRAVCRDRIESPNNPGDPRQRPGKLASPTSHPTLSAAAKWNSDIFSARKNVGMSPKRRPGSPEARKWESKDPTNKTHLSSAAKQKLVLLFIKCVASKRQGSGRQLHESLLTYGHRRQIRSHTSEQQTRPWNTGSLGE